MMVCSTTDNCIYQKNITCSSCESKPKSLDEHVNELAKRYIPTETQVGGDHYKNFAIQPAEFCERNKLDFLESCVIKRMCRHENKNGREDLEKAKHEIDLILEIKYSG